MPRNPLAHIFHAATATMPEIIEEQLEKREEKFLLRLHDEIDKIVLGYMLPKYSKNEVARILGISVTRITSSAKRFGWKLERTRGTRIANF